jgi:FlaG/FlaF family flagellin (archaellin)
VIGTILMVAITVVLAALLYVLVSSLLQPPAGQSLHLVLTASPNTTNATNSSWRDTYFTVQAKTGPGEIYWNSSSLQVLVFSPDGILLTGHNISFDDQNPGGKADAGDKIHLRGMTSAYPGGKMKLLWDNAVVAEIAIP